MTNPTLSIVVTSRNDNHGGDMTRRMTMFINGLIRQANKFNFPIELILVEWNPPSDKSLLKEILPQPKGTDQLCLRYIIVPEETHRKYELSGAIPLYQMIAKNVGIRRATAPFVLCTNVDILFSDEIFEIFARNKFEENFFYRANRCDIPSGIDEKASFENQLVFCKNNILQRWGFDADFIDLIGLPKILTSRYSRWFTYAILKPLRRYLYPYRSISSKIDYYACGDFTLMSKKDWLNLDGYVELDLYSLHIDSLLLSAAMAAGMQQVVFPKEACVYHITHSDGWASMNPIQSWIYTRNNPALDWKMVNEWSEYIIRHKINYGINNSNWGFADQKFKEYSFNTASTHS